MNRTEMESPTTPNADEEVNPINSSTISPAKDEKENGDGMKTPIEEESEEKATIVEEVEWEEEVEVEGGEEEQGEESEAEKNQRVFVEMREVWREIFADTDPPPPAGHIRFRPVRDQWSIDQCQIYGFPYNEHFLRQRIAHIHDHPFNVPKVLNAPLNTKNIVCMDGDGNTLFRALAWWLTGSEEEYRPLRKEIIHFMFNFPDEFGMKMTGDEGQKYTKEANRRMLDDGEWGTPCEIYGAATLFGVDIYTFHEGKWKVFSPLFEWTVEKGVKITRMTERNERTRYGLYLTNDNNLHYDVAFKDLGKEKSTIDYELTKRMVEEVATNVAKLKSAQREELLFLFHSIIYEEKEEESMS